MIVPRTPAILSAVQSWLDTGSPEHLAGLVDALGATDPRLNTDAMGATLPRYLGELRSNRSIGMEYALDILDVLMVATKATTKDRA
jgi:hypothetical protein